MENTNVRYEEHKCSSWWTQPFAMTNIGFIFAAFRFVVNLTVQFDSLYACSNSSTEVRWDASIFLYKKLFWYYQKSVWKIKIMWVLSCKLLLTFRFYVVSIEFESQMIQFSNFRVPRIYSNTVVVYSLLASVNFVLIALFNIQL